MSDVHGRKREKTTEELVKARKERDAGKIKEYNALVENCRTKMANKEYSDETFVLTTQIVQWNPDYYTIWNYRRILLSEFILKELNEESRQKVYMKELLLFLQLIKIRPKSYWLWNHRIWCLQHMPKPDWEAELGLVDKMLTMDARNFHGWDYRRFVVGHLRKNAKSEDKLAKIVQDEYEFTTRKINQSFSNYSAWHQRSKLLPEIVADMSEEERNNVAANELDLVKNAIYTDPEDQSAWLYYWWLLGRAPQPIALLGAYQLESSPFIAFGFNDMVKLQKLPQILDQNGHLLSGQYYSVDGGSVWVMELSKAAAANELVLQANSVLPSSSSKSVSHDKVWRIPVKTLIRGPARMHALTKKPWKESSAKMYKDPTFDDQTAWFSLDKIQLLKNEIQTVRELLELEPESAWALQTLVHFLNQLQLRSRKIDKNEIFTEIINILDKLIEIDVDRKGRYQDQKTNILFEKSTKSLVKDDETYNESFVETIDLSGIERIPLLSKLLFVKKLTVSSGTIEKKLETQLPFLEECKMIDMK